MTRILALLAAAAALAPNAALAGPVTVKGSDTMVILAQRWIELYQRANPSAVVQLTGGGSETGIAALINGTTDIAAASRPMTPAEVAQVEARHARHVAQIPVAFATCGMTFGPTRVQDEIFARMPFFSPSAPRYVPQGQLMIAMSIGFWLAATPSSPYPKNAIGRR